MSEVCYLIDPEEMLKASERGDVNKVRELLGRDSTLVNAKGAHNKTPLHWAAEKNNHELAELLISAGADLNAEVSWGMTPLAWAANMGSREAADAFLAHGARPQLNMWCAAGLGMVDVVQSFWEGPNTLKPNAGQTRTRELGNGNWGKAAPPESYKELVSDAFYIAARNGRVEVAKFLLEKGADINYRGFFGAPGLHWAAINGHKPMIEFLIEHGADLTLRDQKFNATALDWAIEGKHDAIAELLRAQSVKANPQPKITEETISLLVDHFYAKVREDREIGPIFNDAVESWPAHLVLLKDFWSTVLLASGRYKGNPLLVHFPMKLEERHFTRWLDLFADTAREVLPSSEAEAVVTKARNIATNIKRLHVDKDNGLTS
jgi:hemoglobin